jgi:hypothetical protein
MNDVIPMSKLSKNPTGVNFINMYARDFCANSLLQKKITKPNFIERKASQCTFAQKNELTPGVDFINILCMHFSNESKLRRFSLIIVWLCEFLAKGYWQKKHS